MQRKFLVSAAAGALLAMTGAAFAQSVVATTDLNVRAGPGPQHQVLGVLGAGQSATLNGCLEGSKWCVVAFENGDGWVYSDYLTGDFGGTHVVVTERPANSGVRIVGVPTDVEVGSTGAITGSVIGVEGSAVAIDPPERVRTYVSSNQIDPVYLDGEGIVGAGLPEAVVLRDIPDYEYRYVYVNNQPVLVEPQSRRIVYVLR